jgi:hypothetical protein
MQSRGRRAARRRRLKATHSTRYGRWPHRGPRRHSRKAREIQCRHRKLSSDYCSDRRWPRAPNLPAGFDPLGTRLVDEMNFEVPVSISHESLRSVSVAGSCPPKTIIFLVVGSNTAVCEKRASGPYCVQVCALANGSPAKKRKRMESAGKTTDGRRTNARLLHIFMTGRLRNQKKVVSREQPASASWLHRRAGSQHGEPGASSVCPRLCTLSR